MSVFVFSQEINKGDIIKDRQFLIDKSEITASDEYGNFVSIRPHRINGTLRNYYVEFFDNLNFTERIEIETQNDTDILDVHILNGKALIFIWEKFERTISLRLDIIDLKTKSKSSKSLYEISKEENPANYKALDDTYNISLEYSEDIVLSFPVFDKKNSHVVARLFSKNLEFVSEQILNVTDSDSYREINFLNLKRFKSKFYTLFQITKDSKEVVYKLFELENGKSRSIEMTTNSQTYELINSKISEDQYIVSGLYSNQKNGGFDGFTYYRIDLKLFSIQSTQQSPFLDLRAKKYFNGLFKGDRNIDINNIFIDGNQNTYIIGQFYEIQRQYVPIGIVFAAIPVGMGVAYITVNPISVKYKTYDDLLIAKINPDGLLEWDNLVELRLTEKTSSNSNKRDTSTFSLFSKDQLHIFMNGYMDMEKEKLIVKQNKRISKTNFYDINVTPQGDIKPIIIFPNEDSDILFRAESTLKSGDDIYILGQGNMRKQLLKMRLQ
ncbi:MAG: hypothetical protein R2797_12615 [Gelidibacter sp.]